MTWTPISFPSLRWVTEVPRFGSKISLSSVRVIVEYDCEFHRNNLFCGPMIPPGPKCQWGQMPRTIFFVENCTNGMENYGSLRRSNRRHPIPENRHVTHSPYGNHVICCYGRELVSFLAEKKLWVCVG